MAAREPGEQQQPFHHGAQWTYQDVFQATGDAVGGHQEENFNRDWPFAFEGDHGQLEVVPDRPGEMDPADIPPIHLVRQDDPTQAYSIDEERDPFILADQRGVVRFGVTYFRDPGQPNRFICPTRVEDHQYVAIKILIKDVVDHLLRRDGVRSDDPYKEVDRMLQLQGNGDFVLPCIEYLQCTTHLFIVTPRGKTLESAIAWRNIGQKVPNAPPPIPPNEAINVFHRVLRIIDYLQSMGINHHDLKPGNLLIMPSNEIVVFDLAKSLRMPYNDTGTRMLMQHNPGFGTPAWMSPEVFHSQNYDGCAMDVWAAAVMFYNMLTQFLLYREPRRLDPHFCYFLLAGALQDDTTRVARDARDQIAQNGHRVDPAMIATHAQFTPADRLFLGTILNVNPQERLTLAELLAHPLFGNVQP